MAAEAEGSGPSDVPLVLGEFLPYRISIAAEAISRLFADRYEAKFGLSVPEWRILAVLGEAAPRSTQQVIAATEMDRVRVSRAVIRLADKGLVLRQGVPNDARAHLLQPTAQGLGVYRRIVPLAREIQAALEAALTSTEMAQFDAILGKLGARASALACPPKRAKDGEL